MLQKKERSSNLELYRIIVMLAIVAHHYVVNSGLMAEMRDDGITLNSIYCYIFGAWKSRACLTPEGKRC